MLIQYVVPLSCRGGRVDNYSEDIVNKIEIVRDMRIEIKELVSKIQSEFGMRSIIYQEDNPSLEKRLALWS